MSEEEKKAIKELKHYINMTPYWRKQEEYTNIEIDNYIKKVLNLIDKQQKEIEEKTTIIMAGAEKVKQLEKEIQRLEKDNDTLSELVIVNEYKVIKELDLISKDKIRELIKKYQEKAEDVKQKYKGVYAYKSDYLEALAKIEGYQELLEEK